MTRAFLLRILFKDGLRVAASEGGRDATSSLSMFTQDYLEPFIVDCLDEFLKYGMVVYSFVERVDPKFKRKVRFPVVVPFLLCRVQICIDDTYQKTYKVTPLNPTNGTPTLPHYVLKAHEPDVMSGSVQSPVGVCIKHSLFVSELFELALKAERYRNHMPVVLETDAAQVGSGLYPRHVRQSR
jgi:hypothetical protein